MEELIYGVIATFLLLYGLVSKRLESTFLTGPILFVLFGYLISRDGLGLLVNENHTLVYIVANITLILILFTDSCRISLALFKKEQDLPRRLLGIGLPLTIVLGVIFGRFIFPHLPFWQVAVLASVLAPTDAALAQAVINSERVPLRIRQALNVESGLNDGICFPILLLFISLADTSELSESYTRAYWLKFISFQLIMGPLVGIAIGYIGGKLIPKAVEFKWISKEYQRLSILALSVMAFCFAEIVGGNGFIAAFTAGLIFGHFARHVLAPIYEFGETEGDLFIMLTFMLFGAILLPRVIHELDWQIILYGIISLTAARMIPVALSLIGKKLSTATLLYMGWFGPRGAASILYLLVVVGQFHLSGETLIFNVATFTILLSVTLHGVTAVWGSNLYGSMVTSGADKESLTAELPTRIRH